MEKELNVKMNLYIKLKKNETEEMAKARFYKMINLLADKNPTVEYQVFETTVEEVNA
jgi:hypothetical protein